MSELDTMRLEIDHLLAGAERWLVDGVDLDPEPDRVRAEVGAAAAVVRENRVRAASNLLNVAFLGGFSSGKSFLIGGLQNRLEYVVVNRPDELMSEQYLGLLHSTAKVATACPAMVIPVAESAEHDISGRGFLRVRFEGHDEWTDIGNSPKPGEIAAYTTDDPRAIAEWRSAEHRNLRVAEVEILLGDVAIPAKLCDLPGFGAPNVSEEHKRIAREAWKASDCFVYTVQATHTLSQDDLDLIFELYQEHVRSGKRVIWVMSGIDRAAMRNIRDEPEWTDAQEANNTYLRNLWREVELDTSKVDTFIGLRGFLAVSPAWEAKGRYHRGIDETATGERFIAASQMDVLRGELTDMIEAGAGKRHIAQIASETHELVFRRYLALTNIFDAARLSVEQIGTERDDLSRRLAQLTAAANTVRDGLKLELRDAVRQVDRVFRSLTGFLRDHLTDQINEANVLTSNRDLGRIETQKVALLKQFAEQHGPVSTWQEIFENFLKGAGDTIRATLRDTESSADMATASAVIDLERLTVPPSEKYRTSSQDIVQAISGVVGISTPVAAAVAAALGVATGPILIVPAAVTVLAGVVFTVLRSSRQNRTQLDEARKAMIAGLDEVAGSYRNAFLAAAQLQGLQVIDRVDELIGERREDMSRRIILLERRLAEPEYVDRTQLITRLDPHLTTARSMIDALKALSR